MQYKTSEKQRAWDKARYWRDRDKRLAKDKKRYVNNRGKMLQYSHEYYMNFKSMVLSHYGPLICPCGENNLIKLSLDHINGDGKEHRAKIGLIRRSGHAFYTWLKRNNFPRDPPLQILCRSCNSKKH